MMERWLRLGVDVVTLMLGVAALTVLGARYLETPAPLEPVTLDMAATGIDYSAGDRNLVMALQSDCPFCQESMPFYRRLLERDTADVQIVVAAPPQDSSINDYLASEGVNPDSIVFVEPGVLPISGTPTLLLVDSEGLVVRAWIGLLNPEREEEVIDALFG